jgi:hypothetical protein
LMTHMNVQLTWQNNINFDNKFLKLHHPLQRRKYFHDDKFHFQVDAMINL